MNCGNALILIQLMLAVLKLTKIVTWSWLLITAPVWIPLTAYSLTVLFHFLVAFATGQIVRRKKLRPSNFRSDGI